MIKANKISFFASIFKTQNWILDYLKNMISIEGFTEFSELILINTNSPDTKEQEKIIFPYLKTYKNIHYYKYSHATPIYESWNLGISHCSYDYVSNANPDDRKLSNFLKVFTNEINCYPDIDIFYANNLIANNEEELLSPNLCKFTYDMPEVNEQTLLVYNPPHNAPVWKKELHERFGGFSDKYSSGGDGQFWMECLLGKAKFKKINKICGIYYFCPTGLTTGNDEEKRKRDLLGHQLKNDYARKFGYNGPLYGSLSDIVISIS